MTEDTLLAQMPALIEAAWKTRSALAARQMVDEVARTADNPEMSFRMIEVLAQLRGEHHGLRVSQIADRCGMSAKVIRTTITALETRGFVAATRVGVKINLYTVTPAGLAYLEARA